MSYVSDNMNIRLTLFDNFSIISGVERRSPKKSTYIEMMNQFQVELCTSFVEINEKIQHSSSYQLKKETLINIVVPKIKKNSLRSRKI